MQQAGLLLLRPMHVLPPVPCDVRLPYSRRSNPAAIQDARMQPACLLLLLGLVLLLRQLPAAVYGSGHRTAAAAHPTSRHCWP
jgi:hypothetical protein